MQIAIVTLFPGMFGALTGYGITARAVQQNLVSLRYYSPRDYTHDRHRTVDDKPYGGGPGMLMKTGAELPLAETSEARGMRLSLKPPTQDET